MEDRVKMVNVRLSGEHLNMLDELCEYEVRDYSSMLRYLVVKEYTRLVAQREQERSQVEIEKSQS